MSDHVEYVSSGKPHPYHIVRPSIWPMLSAFSAGFMAFAMILFMHKVEWLGVTIGVWAPIMGLIMTIVMMFCWWGDITMEAVKEKAHSPIVKIGFRYGIFLFILSELMFFVAFFWGFFNASLYPVAGVWPPEGVATIPALELPLLMTMILLLSGCTVTWAHHEIIEGNNKNAATALAISVGLGLFFMCFQVYEYAHAPFLFKDGIYSSVFYIPTGFHGFHVLVGTIFLFVCYLRVRKMHFTKDEHFGFEAAAWYWHFVDVVWLFLFVAIYMWGSGGPEHHMAHGLIH